MPSGERYFNSAKPKSSIDREILLIVEGKDDAYFFDSLLDEIGADPQKVGVVFITGKDALSENLVLLKKSRRFIEGTIRRLAVVRDADTSGSDSLEIVQSALRDHGFASPGQGTFEVTRGSPEVGIFIVPSADGDGDLEKLCLSTISDDARLRMVVEFIDTVQEAFGQLNHIYKRRAMTYFAVSPTENRGVGWTFSTTDMFNHEHECLDDVRDFLKRLIG